jgi:hypothetical protein
MKNCPTCNRTYDDETLTFCLEDGVRLSSPYDPRATLPGPATRATDPPRTEILPPHLAPGNQGPATLLSSNPAFVPLAYPQGTPQQLTQKHSAKHWIILSGVLGLVLVGLVIVLGYMVWKANSKSNPEPASLSSPARPDNDVPSNANKSTDANKSTESKRPADTSSQWLDGRWEGEGYQSDTKTTWAVRLNVQDGTYAIEYPNIPCRGRWTLIDMNSRAASFTEVITQGTDLCDNNNHVMIEKMNDSEISCKYTRASSRVVIATAVLSKKAQANE